MDQRDSAAHQFEISAAHPHIEAMDAILDFLDFLSNLVLIFDGTAWQARHRGAEIKYIPPLPIPPVRGPALH